MVVLRNSSAGAVTIPYHFSKSTTWRENHAPFGAILCAARGQMCGWVKPHPYKPSGNRLFPQVELAKNTTHRRKSFQTMFYSCITVPPYFPKKCRPQFCKIPCKNHHKLPHRFVQFFLRFLRAPAAKICTAEVCAYSSSGSPACMGAALPITSILFW